MTHLLLSKHEKLLLGPHFTDLWQLFHPKLSEPSIPVHQNKQVSYDYETLGPFLDTSPPQKTGKHNITYKA